MTAPHPEPSETVRESSTATDLGKTKKDQLQEPEPSREATVCVACSKPILPPFHPWTLSSHDGPKRGPLHKRCITREYRERVRNSAGHDFGRATDLVSGDRIGSTAWIANGGGDA